MAIPVYYKRPIKSAVYLLHSKTQNLKLQITQLMLNIIVYLTSVCCKQQIIKHLLRRSLGAIKPSISRLHLWHQSIAVEKSLDTDLHHLLQQFVQKQQVGYRSVISQLVRVKTIFSTAVERQLL